MEVLPVDYATKDATNVCKVQFNNNSNQNNWILGEAFLKGFYAVHDHANKQIGFAPHSTSKKSDLVKGTVPLLELPSSDFPVWAIVLLSFAGAGILGIVIWLIVDYLILEKNPAKDAGDNDANLIDPDTGAIIIVK
jgi:hypothetical protein